jgi:hypothetical protein
MKNKFSIVMPLVLLASVAMVTVKVSATATTHIWGPSTDVQAFKLWHITSDLYIPMEKDAAGNHPATVTNAGLTVGFLPFQKINSEVGFDHKTGLGSADDVPLYLNFKVGIPEDAVGAFSPALAVGAFDIGTKSELTDYNVFYGKIAKTFNARQTPLGRFSLGYFTGNKKLLLDSQGQKDNSGVMVAWERTITEISDKLWVCLEYMGTKSTYGTFNVGAAWKFAPNVGVIVGYDLFNDENFIDTATLQVDIDF